MLYPEAESIERPKTRADCANVPRPCVFVGCRHNLYIDVNVATGSIKFNHPDLEPDEVESSCSLDIAEEQGATLEEVGYLMNITRERIRQIEEKVLNQFSEEEVLKMADFDMREFADERERRLSLPPGI